MARKHPLDDPPAVSSSEEEEEEAEVEEEEDDDDDQPNAQNLQNHVGSEEEDEELAGDEGGGGDDDDDDEEDEDVEEELERKKEKNQPSISARPISKNSNHRPPSRPNTEQDSDGSETESDLGPVSNSPRLSDFAIKSCVVSKTFGDSPKAKKPATVADKTPAKRPAESSDHLNGKDSKLKTKKAKTSNSNVNGGEEGMAAPEKKGTINRLWSDEDEIAILKGMIEFQLKRGTDPNSDYTAFHEFMKNYVSVDVSRNQLMDKVRRLKKKFRNNVGKGGNGEDPPFSKPHDHKCFQLSKKIWGGVVAANDGKTKHKGSVQEIANKSNAKSSRKSDKADGDNVHVVDPSKVEVLVKNVEQESKGKEGGFLELYPFLSGALKLSSQASGSLFTDDGVKIFEQNASLVGKSRLKEMEEKCRKQKLSETEVFIRRTELTQELAEIMIKVIKSQKS